MIFVGMLALGYANAQEERVGINTENPSATLNVKTQTDAKSPKNLELENQAGTKLMTVLNDGKVGINNSDPEALVDIIGIGDNYPLNGVRLRTFRNLTGAGDIVITKARGTKDAPLSVKKVDLVGGFSFTGYNGTIYNGIGGIYGQVTDIASNGTLKGSLLFNVFPDPKGVNPVGNPEMILHHTGNLGVGLGSRSANTTDLEPNDPKEKLHIGGAIKLSTEYSTSTISDGAKTPVPNGGAGTIIHQNGHFFGWVSDTNGWKQLDNEISASASATAVKLDNIKDNKPICNDTTVGTISFGTITANGKSTDAFGFCMKNSDGQAKWFYIYGGSAATGGGSGEFGAGL